MGGGWQLTGGGALEKRVTGEAVHTSCREAKQGKKYRQVKQGRGQTHETSMWRRNVGRFNLGKGGCINIRTRDLA